MFRAVLLLVFLSVTTVLAQDTKEADAEAKTESSEQAAEQAPDDDVDDIDDLDELYPVEEEDAFIPSENVAFGQSIPFPTDI